MTKKQYHIDKILCLHQRKFLLKNIIEVALLLVILLVY